jgi:predicted phage-related endonuclease
MEEAMSGNAAKAWNSTDRRQFIGGSDARIIMGQDEEASIRVCRRLKNQHER